MSRINQDAEEEPGQGSYQYTRDPMTHSLANQPTNYTSQLQQYSIPHMQQQGNLRPLTVPQTASNSYQYQQQQMIGQSLPTLSTHQSLPTMPSYQSTSVSPYSLPVAMGAQMEQRDEFNSLIQEIVNELSTDRKVMPELRFIFSDKFTTQEMDKVS